MWCVSTREILAWKVGLAALLTAAWAYALEQRATAVVTEEGVAWSMIAGIILFSLLGWAIADLDKLAELWNPVNSAAYERKKISFSIIKGGLASLGAGAATFIIGTYLPALLLPGLGLKTASGTAPEIPEMVLLLLSAGAAFGGSRWWSRWEEKATPGPGGGGGG